MLHYSLIHLLSLFLFINSGSNDGKTTLFYIHLFNFSLVLISCAMQIGSRSLNRRSLILFASISLIFTYYTLKSIQQTETDERNYMGISRTLAQ